jgi:hypothetical protein
MIRGSASSTSTLQLRHAKGSSCPETKTGSNDRRVMSGIVNFIVANSRRGVVASVSKRSTKKFTAASNTINDRV